MNETPIRSDAAIDNYRFKSASTLGAVFAVILFWWLYREFSAAGPGGYRALVWIGIAFLSYYTAAAIAMAIPCLFVPAAIIGKVGTRSLVGSSAHMAFWTGSLLVYLTRDVDSWPWVATVTVFVFVLGIIRCSTVRIPTKKPRPSPAPPSAVSEFTSRVEDEARWDVFLSYRTSESNAARRLADSFFRQGYIPWFAEYEIPPDEWRDNEANKEAIARRLIEGVARSRYFLVITNDGWARSEWCNREMEAITGKVKHMKSCGRISSAADILAEIRLPPAREPHEKFEELGDVRHYVVEHDILDVWRFLQDDLGWFTDREDEGALLGAESAVPATVWTTVSGGLTFPLAGLERFDDVFDPAYGQKGWEFDAFRGEWLGEQVKLRVLVNPFRNKLGMRTTIAGESDDRSLVGDLIGAFRRLIESHAGMTALGTHLVHLPDGHSGPAFSSHMEWRSGEYSAVLNRTFDIPLHPPALCRKCLKPLIFYRAPESSGESDILAACENRGCSHAEFWPVQNLANVGEVEYTFALDGKGADAGCARKRLARFSPIMEAIVRSTRRKWWAGLLDWQAAGYRALMLLAALEGARYTDIAMSPRWLRALWLALVGFTAVELLFAIGIRGDRREIMTAFYGGKMALPLGSWFPRWWNIMKGGILRSGIALLGGFLPIGLVTLVAVFAISEHRLLLMIPLGAATACLGGSILLESTNPDKQKTGA